MPIIYMVRHGRIASDSAHPRDPELSPQGRQQARAVAQELRQRLPGPLPILTSPLRRCQETAAPLGELWQVSPVVEPRVAEILAPKGSRMNRSQWLRQVAISSWPQLIQAGKAARDGYDTRLAGWLEGVHAAVLACSTDTVIFSHFVSINVIAGRALQVERVACFRPDHTSITVFESGGGGIRLIELGREVETRIA